MKNLFPFLFLKEWNRLFDSILSVWISLGFLHGNNCLFPFHRLVILGIEIKK